MTQPSTRAQIAAKTPEWRAGRAGWLFIAPAIVLIAVFFFLPVGASLLLSITDFDLYAIANPSNVRFVGTRNYTDLLQNPTFWLALKNTFYFALIGGPLTVATSLGAALLLNAKVVRFKTLFRTIYFLPFVTTLVAVAIVWRYLYHPQYGFLNYALGAIGIHPIDWLGDPALGDARDHPARGVEELRLQHADFHRRLAGGAGGTVRGRRARRCRRLAASSGTSSSRISRRPSSSSASSP